MPKPPSIAMEKSAVWFATTHWTVVLEAGRSSEGQSAPALERLCQTYWYPLYAYARRQGYPFHDAKDLTQGFFLRFLEKDYLRDVDRAKGRFRSFLLAAFRHFLADQFDRATAWKRGGRQPVLSLDEMAAESRYLKEPADHMTPDRVFERQWVYSVLDQARRRLGDEYRAAGKETLFEELSVARGTESGSTSYAELAARLGLTEKAVRSEAYRLRRRYHELVCEEIAGTVATPLELEEEIRHLISVLQG